MSLLLTKWAGKSASPLAVSWSVISWYRSLLLQLSCSMKCSSFIGTSFCSIGQPLHALSRKAIQSYHLQVEEKLKDILLRFKYYLSRGDGRNQAQLVDQLDKLLMKPSNWFIWITRTISFTRRTTTSITLR